MSAALCTPPLLVLQNWGCMLTRMLFQIGKHIRPLHYTRLCLYLPILLDCSMSTSVQRLVFAFLSPLRVSRLLRSQHTCVSRRPSNFLLRPYSFLHCAADISPHSDWQCALNNSEFEAIQHFLQTHAPSSAPFHGVTPGRCPGLDPDRAYAPARTALEREGILNALVQSAPAFSDCGNVPLLSHVSQ